MYQFKEKNHFQLTYYLPSILRDIPTSEMLKCEKEKGLGNDSIVCVYFLDEWRGRRLREGVWFTQGHTVWYARPVITSDSKVKILSTKHFCVLPTEFNFSDKKIPEAWIQE